MMTTNTRFIARPLARAPFVAAAAAAPARQPLGYAGADDPKGLADALDAIQRNPPRSMPALGDDLLAEALLQYARRNSAERQAAPLAGADIGGGGGYGAAPDGAQAAGAGAPGDPSAAASLGPRIDELNLGRSSPQWAALMQRYLPQIGPAGSGGYAPGG